MGLQQHVQGDYLSLDVELLHPLDLIPLMPRGLYVDTSRRRVILREPFQFR
jgi:hypothetical protein